MELKTRITHAFIEIKVDEIETTIFKSNIEEVEATIANLLSVVDDLTRYTGKSVHKHVDECGF